MAEFAGQTGECDAAGLRLGLAEDVADDLWGDLWQGEFARGEAGLRDGAALS